MPSGANKKSPAGGGGGGGNGKANKKQLDNQKNQKDVKAKEPGDEDINSGFGEYMRSPQAAEMMKLFVIANTLVVFFTMAWPQMKQSFEIIQSMIYGDEDDELTGVWRLIGNYFQQEFKVYLDEEVKKNKYLLVDPVVDSSPTPAAAAGSSTVEIVTEDAVRQAGHSVTANRLLDEMIVNFGRLFTTRNEAEFSRKRTPAAETQLERPAKEIVSSSSKNIQKESIPPDPNPGGAAMEAPAVAATIIESDKFPRSSSSDGDNAESDDGHDGASDDEEEKWINYWKRRERGSVAIAGEHQGEGHCEAKLDACGP